MGGSLGLGLDYQHRKKYPEGLHGLIGHFADRLSHVSIVALEDKVDVQHFLGLLPENLPVIHHLSSVAPASVGGVDWERLEQMERISSELNALWCVEDIGLWHLGPYKIPYFTPPVFDRDIAAEIGQRIAEMRQRMQIPFHAEIPSCSFVLGECDLGEFFNILIREGKCNLLLDVSHVFSYALATERSVTDVLYSLPLDSVQEIHIAGGRVSRLDARRYIDSHSDAVMPEVLELLNLSIQSCPNLRAITYEIGSNIELDAIAESFYIIENVIISTDWVPRLELDHTTATV
ncbi:MAG: DUF692 family multinuclear iron-containing protein [Arenicellales bacterium]